jgi:hypothetical protein
MKDKRGKNHLPTNRTAGNEKRILDPAIEKFKKVGCDSTHV